MTVHDKKRRRYYNPECDKDFAMLDDEEKRIVNELANIDYDGNVALCFKELKTDPKFQHFFTETEPDELADEKRKKKRFTLKKEPNVTNRRESVKQERRLRRERERERSLRRN